MAGNSEKDFVELKGGSEEIRCFFEDPDGWWRLEGGDEGWEYSADPDHGFLTSFNPPGGPFVELGTTMTTHRGRRLVVASILRKGQQLKVILMPEE